MSRASVVLAKGHRFAEHNQRPGREGGEGARVEHIQLHHRTGGDPFNGIHQQLDVPHNAGILPGARDLAGATQVAARLVHLPAFSVAFRRDRQQLDRSLGVFAGVDAQDGVDVVGWHHVGLVVLDADQQCRKPHTQRRGGRFVPRQHRITERQVEFDLRVEGRRQLEDARQVVSHRLSNAESTLSEFDGRRGVALLGVLSRLGEQGVGQFLVGLHKLVRLHKTGVPVCDSRVDLAMCVGHLAVALPAGAGVKVPVEV